MVPKLGLRWQPLDDSLTIRATWGKGFREPSLFELFSSPTSALSPVTDILPTSLGGPPTPVGDPTSRRKQSGNSRPIREQSSASTGRFACIERGHSVDAEVCAGFDALG